MHVYAGTGQTRRRNAFPRSCLGESLKGLVHIPLALAQPKGLLTVTLMNVPKHGAGAHSPKESIATLF